MSLSRKAAKMTFNLPLFLQILVIWVLAILISSFLLPIPFVLAIALALGAIILATLFLGFYSK